MPDVGRLLARGRDGDIFEYGSEHVLRRTRDGRSIEHEARVMRFAAEQGYPVPRVEDVRAGGVEIVMERIDGPVMMDAMLRRPWTMRRSASTLADLHDRLHEIPAPNWLRRLPDGGDRLVHMDLHPMNVMLSPRGPVVIDWTGAAAGEPLTDVAMTYVLLTCPDLPAPRLVQSLARPLRAYLASAFTRRHRSADLWRHIADAAEMKTHDRNMSASEVAALRRLAARARTR